MNDIHTYINICNNICTVLLVGTAFLQMMTHLLAERNRDIGGCAYVEGAVHPACMYVVDSSIYAEAAEQQCLAGGYSR